MLASRKQFRHIEKALEVRNRKGLMLEDFNDKV